MYPAKFSRLMTRDYAKAVINTQISYSSDAMKESSPKSRGWKLWNLGFM